MKGATTEPCESIKSPPKTTITKMIGANQSFFRTRRNIHSSFKNSINHFHL